MFTGIRLFKSILIVVLLFTAQHSVIAQNLLSKTISISAQNEAVKSVLKKIGDKNDFYFSYNSNIVKQDSLVAFAVQNKTVRQVLEMLFADKYEYTEKGKYIIIERAGSQFWYVSGYVYDETTHEKLRDVSIYEEQQLTAAMTNDQGYFRLRLKKNQDVRSLNIRKSWYEDTAIQLKPGTDQEITVSITPKNMELDAVVVTPFAEKSWLSRFFLSSKQRAQSLNLNKYFVDKPYQASLIPGVSTHGKLGSQVVNKFSFNMLGGYTAGVNGFEIGGIFNIVQKDVRYAQVGGLFNVVGGEVDGVQVGGLYNHVMDSVSGTQVGGIANYVDGDVTGGQIGGIYNHVNGKVDGGQIAGISNYVHGRVHGSQISGISNFSLGEVSGTQISGISNFTYKDMNGVQITGIVNYARKLDGIQIGLINISDTSSGYSIGLINFVRKGYHKICLYANEVTNANVATKTGNKRLYSILLAGYNFNNTNEAFCFGYGIGKEIAITKKLAINPEISAQHIHLGDWYHANIMSKVNLNLTYNFSDYFSVFAGPSYTFYYTNQTTPYSGRKFEMPAKGYPVSKLGNNVSSWVGGSIGISFF
jgi:hypothetical protein